MSDRVNPAHYKDHSIEPIDVIEAWGLGFHLGNCVKYIARLGLKEGSPEIEDLKKARWYLDRKIEAMEAASSARDVRDVVGDGDGDTVYVVLSGSADSICRHPGHVQSALWRSSFDEAMDDFQRRPDSAKSLWQCRRIGTRSKVELLEQLHWESIAIG